MWSAAWIETEPAEPDQATELPPNRHERRRHARLHRRETADDFTRRTVEVWHRQHGIEIPQDQQDQAETETEHQEDA